MHFRLTRVILISIISMIAYEHPASAYADVRPRHNSVIDETIALCESRSDAQALMSNIQFHESWNRITNDLKTKVIEPLKLHCTVIPHATYAVNSIVAYRRTWPPPSTYFFMTKMTHVHWPCKGTTGPICRPLISPMYAVMPMKYLPPTEPPAEPGRTQRKDAFPKIATTSGNGPSYYSAMAAYDQGDYGTALRIFRKLADDGNASAQFNLGIMYQFGWGTPANNADAAKFFRLAAEQGLASAQGLLSVSYAMGWGVRKDNVLAYKWLYLVAAQQGYELQRESLDKLAHHMTTAQIARARKLAHSWASTHGVDPLSWPP